MKILTDLFSGIVRKELASTTRKILFGIILTTVVLISVFMVSDAISALINESIHAHLIAILTFGTLATAASVALHNLFSIPLVPPPPISGHALREINIEVLANAFSDGFVKGFALRTSSEPSIIFPKD